MRSREKWRSCLRVRYRGDRSDETRELAVGAEGIVYEFVGPLGDDQWQVMFPNLGMLNVPSESLEVLDKEFVRERQVAEQDELEEVLNSATEATLYSTRKNAFRRLVIWRKGDRHTLVEDYAAAQGLIRQLKDRRLPIVNEVWFD